MSGSSDVAIHRDSWGMRLVSECLRILDHARPGLYDFSVTKLEIAGSEEVAIVCSHDGDLRGLLIDGSYISQLDDRFVVVADGEALAAIEPEVLAPDVVLLLEEPTSQWSEPDASGVSWRAGYGW